MVGYFSSELGVGDAGRRVGELVQSAGLPVQYLGIGSHASRQQHKLRFRQGDRPRFDQTILAVNADQVARAVATCGLDQHPRGYRIGLWFWEVEIFPERWLSAFDLLDEIWCASEFTCTAIQAVSPKPVRLIRLPISPPRKPTPYTRQDVGLPETFCFLFTFDFNSVFERKNPTGVLKAYLQAFGPHDGAHLVLKSVNGHRHPDRVSALKEMVSGRQDVSLQDGYLSGNEVHAQIELCDCFVSLHRSEGFGLNIAAAMSAGVPVVATGYSGNMTYTDPADALLVNYTLAPVGRDASPYPENAYWAEPDTEHAARLMRSVFDRPEDAQNHARRAREYMLALQSPKAGVASVMDSLFR